MKCLTVQQPWASLLLGIAPAAGPDCAPGIKDVENRRWCTSYRGDLLIHAGKAFDDWAMDTYYDGAPDDRFPRGVVLGMVSLDGMVAPGADAGTPWQDRAQWKWRVSRPRVFAKYVPLRGAQGLFEVNDPAVLSMAKASSGGSTAWWESLGESDREWFVERVGILEFDGGFSRHAAVHEAYAQWVVKQHGERASDDPDGNDVDGVAYFGVSESWWHRWDRDHGGGAAGDRREAVG